MSNHSRRGFCPALGVKSGRMGAEKSTTWGLFGGAGFIGQHLALSILELHPRDTVQIFDIVGLDAARLKAPLEPFIGTDRLLFQICDVRDSTQLESLDTTFDVIVNLAAVHREPGHRAEEYSETNIKGAENLCALAERTGCKEIIFTSSISVYGVHDRPVDESDPPQPKTPYGQSKYKSELIHIDWAQRTNSRLMIVRPGVVFGPGENGNVTRLVREMLNRNRPIRLEPNQPKDGIYIQELLGAIYWLRDQDLADGQHHLVNAVSNERLSFNAFGEALSEIHSLQGKALNIPAGLVKLASSLARPLSPLFPAASRFHPERIAKICRGNDIRPTALETMGFPFAWPLQRALADWLERGL